MHHFPPSDRIYQDCRELIFQRLEAVRTAIDAVQQSANSETKSTAGDKHETGRAMAQLEVEMLSKQLSEAARMLESLERTRANTGSPVTQPGSVVETSQGIFYLAVPLGKVEIDGHNIIAISPEAPIAKAILGCQAGDVLTWNGQNLMIVSVT